MTIDQFGQSINIPARSPNLSFSTDISGCIAAADVIFVSVNTPTKTSGIGAGAATNLAAFEGAVISIAKSIRPGAILVEKSTVPCGTAQTIQNIVSLSLVKQCSNTDLGKLALYRPNEHFEVLSNPEFLAEGTAVKDLLYPDRIIIGSSPTPSGYSAASVLRSVYTSWVEESKILTLNVWSSELAKLVANAMLAQRISSINTISAICDQTGADIDEVATAIGCDNRLGNKFLKAGVGFGGSCFKKDILSLAYLARSLHLPEVADYWMSVLDINEFQRSRFMCRVVSKLNGALVGKKITVLGYTFKPDTNDTRESPAIDVIKAILCERPAEIAIFDPGCTPLEIRENISTLASTSDPHVLKPHGPVQAYSNAYDACSDSSAILILTPWRQFRYPQPTRETDIIPTGKSLVSSRFSGLTIRKIPSEIEIVAIEASSRTRLGLDALDDFSHGEDPLNRMMPQPRCPPECKLCTEHHQPKAVKATENVDWAQVASTMRESKWIFDGRNIVDGEGMARLGFRVESLGKGKTMLAGRNCSASYY